MGNVAARWYDISPSFQTRSYGLVRAANCHLFFFPSHKTEAQKYCSQKWLQWRCRTRKNGNLLRQTIINIKYKPRGLSSGKIDPAIKTFPFCKSHSIPSCILSFFLHKAHAADISSTATRPFSLPPKQHGDEQAPLNTQAVA